ncbi:MAG: TRAP transporter TatT component family protein [Proteobacteria bacterium]|nr:TRAP transporter TatT component family protein [Pseudomonadota bacterium]
MNIFKRLFLCIIPVLCLSSCSPRMFVINEITAISETGAAAFEQDDDLEMVEKAIPGNVKLFEALLENSPDNYRLLILLSRLYASYSFAFFEGKLEASLLTSVPSDHPEQQRLRESVNRYYMKGADYALRALKTTYPEADVKFKNPGSADIFLEKMTREDVPALFWYGFNLGSCINLNRDSVYFISKAFLAEKIMNRVTKLDPDYYYGGAHLFLIAYYSSVPPYSDEKLKLSLFHYNRLKEHKGDAFMLAELYYGRYYLWRRQEKEKFEEVMKDIMQYSGRKKEYLFYNAIAAQRAKIYLEAAGLLFE